MERSEDLASRIDQARLQARTATEAWVGLAVNNLEHMVMSSDHDRTDAMEAAFVGIRNQTAQNFTAREVDIRGFVDQAHTRIEHAILSPEEHHEIKSWFRAYVANHVKPTRESHDKAINTSEDSICKIFEQRYNEQTASITSRTNEQVARLAQHRVDELGFIALERRIAEVTANINRLITSKEQDFDALIQAKLTAHASLLATKKTQFSTVLASALSRLDAKIRAEQVRSARSSRSGQSRSHQQTHDWEDDTIIRPRNHQAKRPPQRPDPRIQTLMGRSTGLDKQPFVTVLGNIDHHRGNGKSDEEIYKLLVRKFHPDVSDREHGEDVIKVLGVAYDKQLKKFIV